MEFGSRSRLGRELELGSRLGPGPGLDLKLDPVVGPRLRLGLELGVGVGACVFTGDGV